MILRGWRIQRRERGDSKRREGKIDRERGPGERCGGRKMDCRGSSEGEEWEKEKERKKERLKERKNGNATLGKGIQT
jgi:hypothetical protein